MFIIYISITLNVSKMSREVNKKYSIKVQVQINNKL